MNKILLTSIKGLAVSLGKEVFKQVKQASKVSIKTNSKEIFNNLKVAVTKFKKAVSRDSKQLKEAVKANCKIFKENITQDCKEFKENVTELVQEVEATILVNDKKAIEFKNKKISINSEVLETYTTDIMNALINFTMNAVVNKLNTMETSTAQAA